ncbi:MAG: hypothetical protein WC372_09945 [Candidatus Neomarinimicrobiota bacterium]|jgi:hypothetical protein|nr:hypothetical protein [Candidatus Neomarinimicrobiota bacterium]MDD3966898.1 hypothetical protein [Candidatus Neomarinimicrobiota bacterium]MDX9780839.1 hypothetical protein [bacterium]
MKVYDNVKNKLSRWWESLSPKIDEAYQSTRDKAGDFSRLGKLRYEVFQSKRILQKCYQELGEKAAEYIDDGHGYDLQGLEQIEEMMNRIHDLRVKIGMMENEAEHLQETKAKEEKAKPKKAEEKKAAEKPVKPSSPKPEEEPLELEEISLEEEIVEIEDAVAAELSKPAETPKKVPAKKVPAKTAAKPAAKKPATKKAAPKTEKKKTGTSAPKKDKTA